LHGVGEERDFVGLADGEEFTPGLDDAGFVVRAHHGDNAGASVGHFGGKPFHVHHAVISIGALDADFGPSDSYLAEAEFARMVLSRGENRILISDSSKFGKTALIKVCDFKDINRLCRWHS
jgi:DeoR family glycerol-3-phosphate regulon repressor